MKNPRTTQVIPRPLAADKKMKTITTITYIFNSFATKVMAKI